MSFGAGDSQYNYYTKINLHILNKHKRVVRSQARENGERWKGQNAHLQNSVVRGFSVVIFWWMTICFCFFVFLIKHTVISCQAKNTDRVVFWLLRCNYIRHQPQWLHQRKRENKQEKHGQESCFTHWVERLEEYNLGLVPIRRIFFYILKFNFTH